MTTIAQVVPLRPAPTLDEVTAEYHEFLVSEGYSETTIALKLRYWRRAVKWLAENRRVSLADASALDVAALAATLPPHRSSRSQLRGGVAGLLGDDRTGSAHH